MSTFVVVRGFYMLLMISVGVIDYFWESIPIIYYLVPTLLFVLLTALGSANIRLNFFMRAKNSLSTESKTIALTFDDGPSADYTPQVLALLERYKAKGTFFCIGEKIKNLPELTKAIHAKGHTIGNHSFSHRNSFPIFSKSRIVRELVLTNQWIYDTIGIRCQLFRPPFGVTNPNIAKAVRHLGMHTIGWNIRSFDTSKSSDKVVENVIKKIKPGVIILLHDDRPQVYEILEAILLYAQENKYTCVALPNPINENYASNS